MPSADPETETEAVVVDEARDALLEAVTTELGDAVLSTHYVPGRDFWVRVETDAWAETADYLRNRQRFRFFDWLSAVDWMPSPFGRSHEAAVDVALETDNEADESDEEAPGAGTGAASYAGGETRFQVLARAHSLATGLGLTVKTDVGEDLTVPTWTKTYPGAGWHEREVFEMFGLQFAGHPRLRNIYLPGDFEGNPMRKDFPLMARLIKPWPGIVDVEPMPTPPEEANADPSADAPSSENPEDAQ